MTTYTAKFKGGPLDGASKVLGESAPSVVSVLGDDWVNGAVEKADFTYNLTEVDGDKGACVYEELVEDERDVELRELRAEVETLRGKGK